MIAKVYRTYAELKDFKFEDHPAVEVYAVEESISLKTLKQISYILASEGPNKNRDFWTKEVLNSCYKSIINEHININHSRDETDDSPEQIIGHNVAAEVVELEDGRTAIKAYAVLYDYAFRHNETYQQLLGILESGALRASMEVLFTEYQLVTQEGDMISEDPDMSDFWGFLLSKDLYRAFSGEVKFCGAAMLLGVPPADPMAIVDDEDGEEEETQVDPSSEGKAEEITNFPDSGDNQVVTLSHSEFPVFDPDYAEYVNEHYSTLFGKSNNLTTLLKIAKNDGVPQNDEEKALIIKRESWAARHFNEVCPVSQLNWLMIGYKGEEEMKTILDREMNRIDGFTEELLLEPYLQEWLENHSMDQFTSRADFRNWLIELKSTIAQEETKVLTYQNLPIDKESDWSGSEAKKRVWDWADGDVNKYSKAFILLRGNPENKTSYRFGIGDIKDGKLVAIWRGITSAMAAVHGARSKPDVSEDVRKQMHNHLAKYYKKAGEKPPDFE